jgi:hypothetical protein
MKSHGHYEIESVGRVLYVDATGPFNEDTVMEKRADLRAAIESLSPDPWGLFVIFREVSLFTPAAEAELVKVTVWRKKMGMAAIAAVFVDVMGPEILAAQMKRVHSAAGVASGIFETTAEARAWLLEKGFEVSNASRQFTD